MGYVMLFFTYIFFPSTKINGTLHDKNNNPISNAKIVIKYSEFQGDVWEDTKIEVFSKQDGSFHAKLKRCSKEYPIDIIAIAGKDTLTMQKIINVKKKLNVDVFEK